MPKSTYPLPDTTPDRTRCVQIQIPDDDAYLQMLLDALSDLSKWLSYERDADRRGKDVAAAWRNALGTTYVDVCGNGDTSSDTNKTITVITIDDDEEEEMKPCYEKFGGTWYIGLPCGDCGGLDWIPLGTGGGPPGSPGGGGSVAPGANGGGQPPNTPPLLIGGWKQCGSTWTPERQRTCSPSRALFPSTPPSPSH